MLEASGLLDGFATSASRSAAPLLLALLGETVSQRSGVINLGSEGQMLVGAAFGFGVVVSSGNLWLGVAAGALAGAILSTVHALLCVHFEANQFASGISVWMLGFGISAYYGAPLVGKSIEGFAPLRSPSWLSGLTSMTFVALLIAFVVAAFLYWTRAGLLVRACGHSMSVVRAAGIRAERVQVLSIIAGGALTGMAGAMLSLDLAMTWAEGMSQGRGLVAAGLVIVARWNPLLAIPTALLFGGSEVLSLRIQSAGTTIPSDLLHTLPYLVCLIFLVVSCLRGAASAAPLGLKTIVSR